jgi:hypothetical protein
MRRKGSKMAKALSERKSRKLQIYVRPEDAPLIVKMQRLSRKTRRSLSTLVILAIEDFLERYAEGEL